MKEIEYDLNKPNTPSHKDEEIVFIAEGENKSSGDEAVEFSKKLLGFLEQEIKKFNSKNERKLRLSQARKMYCLGTKLKEQDEEYTTNEWGLARVNLFLRIISGNIEELNLDISKKTSYNKLMDITHQLIPTLEDFQKAKNDSRDHELHYPYEDIEELYIEEKPIGFYIDY